jgi:hypothetical protein
MAASKRSVLFKGSDLRILFPSFRLTLIKSVDKKSFPLKSETGATPLMDSRNDIVQEESADYAAVVYRTERGSAGCWSQLYEGESRTRRYRARFCNLRIAQLGRRPPAYAGGF